MANNDINHTLTGAPVWTVPVDSTSNTGKSMLLDNNDQELTSYNEFTAPSAPQIVDLPPNYFDISIVPNGAVLHYNEVTSYTESSKAEIKRDTKGVLSFDPLIDENPDQLWLYFMTYLNEKPQQHVRIYGHYTEYYWTTENYQDSDGNTQTRSVQQSHEVTDFDFSLDITPYISEQWWRVAVIPSKKSLHVDEIVTLRTAVEQYTLSKKSIKEVICRKQIHGWNFQELHDKIIVLVRSTGYRNTITITFPISNYRIAARSSSKISRFANSRLVRVLCCISCLCIIFGPIYLCLRALGSTRDHIVADYSMIRPADTFLQLNARTIVNAVVSRSNGHYLAQIA